MFSIGPLLLSGRLGEATIGHLIKPSRPLSRFFHALSSPETSAWLPDTRYATVPQLAGTVVPYPHTYTHTQPVVTPPSPFFLIDGWVEVLAGWMHGCSVLFWFLKLALSFRTHATPLGPSAFHSVSSLFILFTPHPLVLNPAGRFCLLLGLRVCRREFLIFCNFSLRTLISGIF